MNGPSARPAGRRHARWRQALYRVIFEADTSAGKAFDIALLVAILASVLVVCLDSVADFRRTHGEALHVTEWCLTVMFTLEFALRLVSAQKPLRYVFSFFGMVDLLATLPTYFSLFLPGSKAFTIIRAFRLLRIFRILKLARFVGEAETLRAALKASSTKIIVFIGTVLTLVLIIGAMMYIVEGEASGFTSIPQSAYWAIVTMTTVGYGDIAPATPIGKVLASLVMVLGYGVLAVPTGIVSSELAHTKKLGAVTTRACPRCTLQDHDADAGFCKHCGASLSMDE